MTFYEIRTTLRDTIYVEDERTIDQLREVIDEEGTIVFKGDHVERDAEEGRRGTLALSSTAIVSIFEPEDQEAFENEVLER